MEVCCVPQVSSLEELIEELYKVFEYNEVDVDYVQALMESYKSNPQDWKKYAKFDRLLPYTRNLIDEGNGKFNLLMLCWGPSQSSPIHDHADAHCFMKLMQGSLTEVRFDWPEEQGERSEMTEEEQGKHMKQTGVNEMKLNGVYYINDSLGLHRVENRSHSEGSVSLHLYSPPYIMCSKFDENTGKRTKGEVKFYSKFGSKKHSHCIKNA
ncbi:cysteine dioxygenase-like [Eriocheir sinensis]|uniref:cysteine dioxygenase-like n=1 Tax=Eriocheir sinensis TaxID=95602 RepID=UPI0021C88F40|nr:cysteine dioxygenase-like [Eriocheir sinensis]XP_050686475.1 cysteine dioxygenase-like [Eriocheir sinensis]XP_050686476.1 cysteine dioxygenase-like [Eriocheir sinensis]XP_050686477.1 cysteine dioxygenase-like [Eriocheir sinensis]XP_050686478.1 cysteine dioxygenase-like [Eriocheir sinensis]XP_050686479.1 cysteine dioxygenase-like [Eriocheir sinensis]XP_050686481.1 cysteine dioxygenase-like [Eriocheir sinensis]XP_050686482.1 cysteine dioxygenase-like [Eriocheir sinensis]XP_050686483.1 cyst